MVEWRDGAGCGFAMHIKLVGLLRQSPESSVGTYDQVDEKCRSHVAEEVDSVVQGKKKATKRFANFWTGFLKALSSLFLVCIFSQRAELCSSRLPSVHVLL